jgi:Tfp pilus assembly protein PilF
MAESRLETLKNMIEKEPGDSFTKYALGLEYMSVNDIESAKDTLEELRNTDPNYIALYYQLGKVYELLGDENSARKIYEKGIYVSASKGDLHTKSELEQAINELL